MEVSAISNDHRINEQIRANQCRLIGADGEQLGIFALSEAQRIADNQGYDLVEIASQGDPIVCKIMDYSKFRYEQSVKEKQARKNQVKVEIKEMKFRPKVDKHDYETKKKHVLRFLEGGNKVKITIMFRGRETARPELGLNILERLAQDLEGIALLESQPKLEGRNMHMMLSPVKKSSPKAAKSKPVETTSETEAPEAAVAESAPTTEPTVDAPSADTAAE